MKVVVNDNRFAAQRDCISHCHECGILRVHVDESTLSVLEIENLGWSDFLCGGGGVSNFQLFERRIPSTGRADCTGYWRRQLDDHQPPLRPTNSRQQQSFYSMLSYS